MNKFDKFINRFTSDSRSWSEEPRPQEGKIYATDFVVMARVAEHLCGATYSEHDKQPNFIRVFPKEHICSLSMDIREVAKVINTVPVKEFKEVTGKEADCDECEGTGRVTWEYEDSNGVTHEDDFDCPICDGSGKLSHKLLHREDRLIGINGISFKIGKMQRIIDAIYNLGVTEVEVQYLAENEPMLIHVCKDVDVIIMPNMVYEPVCSVTIKEIKK
jgi:hypothetical protein